jgi:hypothetical protein
LLPTDGVKLAIVKDVSTHKPAWGVEYRIVTTGNRRLISLINLTPKPATIDLRDQAPHARDLLSDESLELNNVTLTPMVPRLLEVR